MSPAPTSLSLLWIAIDMIEVAFSKTSFFLSFYLVDVWSVACILVELKTRQPLFRGMNHIDQVKQIMGIVGAPDEELMQKITSTGVSRFIIYIPSISP